MKKLITAMALLAACHAAPPKVAGAPTRPGNQTGAADAIGAVRAFVDAAGDQDLQALGALWGDQDGLPRDRWPQKEVEQREMIMMCFLKHDKYEIVGDAPSPGNTRTVAVNLTLGAVSRTSNFVAAPGPSGRWYVKDFQTAPLEAFCAKR